MNDFCVVPLMKCKHNEKTTPKGFSASKCDVGNWIISTFFGNCLGIFWDSKSQLITKSWKELICLLRFWFLSRFCLRAEGRRKEGQEI
jgi:hypothetical protein